MGNRKSKSNKNIINNKENNKIKEQNLFESFQEKKFAFEITAITYFKFSSEDIIMNEEKESIKKNIIDSNLKIKDEKTLKDKTNKKVKKEIYFDKSGIEAKIFIFLYNIDNLVYSIDSHSFERQFKFREETKENKEKCKIMFQSEHQKSTLICIHQNKLNINKIKIVNSKNKSSIYCDQIQSILFGQDYISIYDIIQINIGKLIIGLEGALFVFDKTNNPEYINMSKSKERKLYEKILIGSNFLEEHKGYIIQNKGEHHYILSKAFYLKKDYDANKLLFIDKISFKNILGLNSSTFVSLININNNSSILRFYLINKKEIYLCENKDIVIKDFQYQNFNISKIFYITDKYFGFINIENIIIISSKFKEIVSIYIINELSSLNNNLNNKSKIFLPNRLLIFEAHYILIQFIDLISKNVYLKIFKLDISNSNEFVEIFNFSKRQIKSEDLIYNILEFKNVNGSDVSAKFFITNNKNNMIKKWIFTI